LRSEVLKTFKASWQTRQGRVIPRPEDLKLDNDGVEISAAVLYADLVDSTGLVSRGESRFAAEVYKAFLTSCCRIIQGNDGVITAFDGDRVMGVFAGDIGSSNATRSALQIAWAVDSVVNAAISQTYPASSFRARHVVGIDYGTMLVARTGVRGYNDLVWTGLAANRAAKLCAIRIPTGTTWISDAVFRLLTPDLNPTTYFSSRWAPWPDPSVGGTCYRTSDTLRLA
jgi:class 3 adenylate cyclase